MPSISLCKSSFFNKLYQPVSDLFSRCRNRRSCPELPDEDWLRAGVSRVLRPDPSGRAFLQALADVAGRFLGRSNFFESLKSRRRLNLLSEALDLLCAKARDELDDPIAQYEALKDFDLYAGDGHYLESATHDPRKGKGAKKYATGQFFALNLRDHTMRHLCVADQDNRKKEHDMRALKRLSAEELRLGAPAGRKVLYAWDKAGIDFPQWFEWKRRGIYFVSLEKGNMKLEVSGENAFDGADPLNRGVHSDQLVSGGAGVMIRRIVYRCPIDGALFLLLTSEMTLTPGLIVLIYKLRWDVEKVFDETKNRWLERALDRLRRNYRSA